MPRDSNGNYTLPSGNPVVTGEVISTGWANPTMSDIGAELTNSLDRQGRGGMLAPFKFVDGTNSQPGMTWTNEPTTGFYRAGGGDMRATVAGIARMRWTSTGVDVYDGVAGTWVALANASGVNFAVKNADNKFSQDQTIVKSSASLSLWKDSTPSLAGRLAFNINQADALELSYYDNAVSSWRSKWWGTNTESRYLNDTHTFMNGGNDTRRALLNQAGLQIGSNGYNPVVGATRYMAVTGEAGNAAEVGVFSNDGTNDPRAALFAAGTVVGLDWIFNTGVASFQFRRAGTPVFSYNQNGVGIGVLDPQAKLHVVGASNAIRYDTGANNDGRMEFAFNGTRVGYLGIPGASSFDISADTKLTFQKSGVPIVNIDNTGLSIINGTQYRQFGADNSTQLNLSVDTAGAAYWNTVGVTAFQWYLNSTLKASISATSFALSAGMLLYFGQYSAFREGIAPMYSPRGVDVEGAKGPVLYHTDATMSSGNVYVSTSEAPASGYTNGTLWLQREA